MTNEVNLCLSINQKMGKILGSLMQQILLQTFPAIFPTKVNKGLAQLSIYIHNSRLKQAILAFFWSLQPLKFKVYPF